jgi:phenylpyruvate tautomerase PptA (4-oxalocrotonate tautomerase family)
LFLSLGIYGGSVTVATQEALVPLVRISLIKGKSPAHVRSIADGVHKALVEIYDVPVNDRFQLIQQLERDDLIYNADYLDIHRTDDIVLINVIASRTRDTATKQAFYKALASNLSENPGLRPEDILIVLSPNDRDDWSFGKGLASYVKDSEQADGARA